MKRVLFGSALIGLLALALAGCTAGADVSSEGVKDKEQQIKEATEKLNGGQAQDQGQGSDQAQPAANSTATNSQ